MTAIARRAALLAALGAVLASPALAHTGAGVVGGFASGFLHPLLGPDHVVAMVAVGLWGGILGGTALWILPVTFPLVMALAGALGVDGIRIPFLEQGIALSGLVLGLMVLLAARPPLAVAAALVGVFAVFHGNAHGLEIPSASNPAAFAAGFVVATGLLHLAGIAVGLLWRWRGGRALVRALGGAIALAGAAFLTGLA